MSAICPVPARFVLRVVGCVKRTSHYRLWCVSRTLQNFTTSPRTIRKVACLYRHQATACFWGGRSGYKLLLEKELRSLPCDAGIAAPSVSTPAGDGKVRFGLTELRNLAGVSVLIVGRK